MSKTEAQSELISAATSLDEELRKFERLAENLRAAPFASQKNLERAAEVLKELSESDQELGRRVSSLVQALTNVRERQQKQAEQVQARALELQERTQSYQQLMEGYGLLGNSAAQLNGLLGKLLGADTGKPPERTPELEEGLHALTRGMWEVASAAQKLGERAHAAGFPDVERLVEGLRQQILSTKNKLKLLGEKLGIPEQAEA